MWLLGFGYFGLFTGAFLASTLLPLPSEGILIGAFQLDLNVILCLAIATIGNFLGGLTNYYIGYKCNNARLLKKLKFNQNKLERIEQKLNKWGYWMGFIAWMPFIGDPLVLVLGFYKTPFIPLAITMFIGKFLRYLLITLIYLNYLNV